MSWLLVIAGAVIGAPLRYLIDRAIQARHGGPMPWGTFTVNMIACLVLGFLTAAALPPTWVYLIGPGLCASLSTYSTFSYETVRLGASRWALVNALGSVIAGLAAAFTGVWLAQVVI
ncbi:CrcB family protein [Pseudonocardiaceae bacterium YIM PH 21723]|nr:CrcB family protein [Pseudonocardiaceae bacterium YIM PH 21723]